MSAQPLPDHEQTALDAALLHLRRVAGLPGSVVKPAVMEQVALGARLPARDWQRFAAAVASAYTIDGAAADDTAAVESSPPARPAPKFARFSGDLDGFGVWLDKACAHRLLRPHEEGALGRRAQAGLLAEQQLAQLDVALPRLVAAAADGRAAINELVTCNVRLVISVARRYQHRGLDLEDLIQEGCLGLYRAAEKFDPDKGFRFSTYATWWVRQAIGRGVADKGRLVRLPVHMGEKLTRLARIEARLFAASGRTPTSWEIAEDWGEVDEREVEMMQRIRRQPLWLDQPVGDDFTRADVLGDGGAGDPARDAVEADNREFVAGLLDSLDARSSEILRRRFGIGTWRQETLDDIGRSFGLTRERIRQLEKRALETLALAIKRHQRAALKAQAA